MPSGAAAGYKQLQFPSSELGGVWGVDGKGNRSLARMEHKHIKSEYTSLCQQGLQRRHRRAPWGRRWWPQRAPWRVWRPQEQCSTAHRHKAPRHGRLHHLNSFTNVLTQVIRDAVRKHYSGSRPKKSVILVNWRNNFKICAYKTLLLIHAMVIFSSRVPCCTVHTRSSQNHFAPTLRI